MLRISILALFLLTVVGCGGGGDAEIAPMEMGEPEMEQQENNEDNEEEINCSDPAFSTVEPLPQGTHPRSWVSLSNNHWNCFELGKTVLRADGTFIRRRDNIDVSQYLADWEACGGNTRRPPFFTGEWVITADDQFCERTDLYPGRLYCFNILLEPDPDDVYNVSFDDEIRDFRDFRLLLEYVDGSTEEEWCRTQKGRVE